MKVILLTGYLGAGKTTLVNHILENDAGIRAAVIVNDIGEVNVDADLIRGGGLSSGDELIPLTNGCICCTLSADLSRQLGALAASGDFDYAIIEASGVCEPIPIAYTIAALRGDGQVAGSASLDLDNIVCVVDARRMWDEFDGGRALERPGVGEDDVESLLIQQIEFCSTLILNKSDLVSRRQMRELRAVVRSLQREAVIIEATNADVPLDQLLDTGRFSFERAFESAAWTEAMAHPEEHEDPEVLEYGIRTFVYERRRPFDVERLTELVSRWPRSVIRAKGQIWCDEDPDVSYLFEQAGRQVTLVENGLFVASAPDEEQRRMLAENPGLARDWDPACGDRLTRLCIIGRHMDRDLVSELDACLTDWTPDDF